MAAIIVKTSQSKLFFREVINTSSFVNRLTKLSSPTNSILLMPFHLKRLIIIEYSAGITMTDRYMTAAGIKNKYDFQLFRDFSLISFTPLATPTELCGKWSSAPLPTINSQVKQLFVFICFYRFCNLSSSILRCHIVIGNRTLYTKQNIRYLCRESLVGNSECTICLT